MSRFVRTYGQEMSKEALRAATAKLRPDLVPSPQPKRRAKDRTPERARGTVNEASPFDAPPKGS